jgi:hypothetical protein
MSTGYANRVIKIDCSDLAEPQRDGNGVPVQATDEHGAPIWKVAPERDGAGNPVPGTGTPALVPSENLWVIIRNPKLMPQRDLIIKPEVDAEGNPVPDEDNKAMYQVFSRLVVAVKLYDANDFSVDEATGIPLPQRMLPGKPSFDELRGLPVEVINRISETMNRNAA